MAGTGKYVKVREGNFRLSTPFTIVKGQFKVAQDFATSARAKTDEYLDKLQETLGELVVPDTSGIKDVVIPEVDTINVITRPPLADLDLDPVITGPSVTKPALLTLPDIPILDIPEYTFSTPIWSEITKPSPATIASPGDAPSLNEVTLPSAPTITLPDVPVLASLSIPSAPSTAIADFDVEVPGLEVLQPPAALAFIPEEYSSDIWTALMAKMLTDIQNGGTGLPEDVELGIWERAFTRAREEYTKSLQDIEAKFGQNGLGLPSGAYTSALLALESDWARKMTDLGYSISEEQAKLAQANSHFIVEQGIKCEGVLRDFFNAQQNRILDAAYKLVLTNVETYKAILQEHNERVTLFQAQVAAYETDLKAVQARVEAYKTSIEGVKVSADVQALLVDIYTKQVQATETKVRLYAVQLEAANTALSVNNQRLTAYKTAIEAYSANLAADKIRYDVYTAELEGEKNKADLYRSQAQAYEALVNAASKKQDAYTNRSEAVTKQNDALINGYRADLQAYEVETNALLKALEAKVTAYQAEATAYNAETNGLVAYYNAKEAQLKAQIDVATLAVTKATAEIKAVTDGYVSLNTLRVEGYKGVANVGAQLTAAALAGIHASSNVGYSAGESMNESWSHGDSVSEQHSFDETPAP